MLSPVSYKRDRRRVLLTNRERDLRLKPVQQRPLLPLFLGMILHCCTLPILIFILFIGITICFGVILLVVFEIGVITTTTITLVATFAPPACFAVLVLLLAFSTYIAVVHVRRRVGYIPMVPRKMSRKGAEMKALPDGEPLMRKKSQENTRHKSLNWVALLLRAMTDDPGSDPREEDLEM